MMARASLRAIFAAPLLVCVVGIIGLVSALTGDGWRDAISWIALAVPVLLVIWAKKYRRS